MLRILSPDDVSALDGVLMRAFDTSESFGSGIVRHLRLEPEGCFVADYQGRPAGMVTSILYGDTAYIGYMAVEPAFQGKGLGRALIKHVMSCVERRGCRTVLLDATVAGEPLYRSLGFEIAGTSLDCRGVPTAHGRGTSSSAGDLFAMDREVFGHDRRRMLESLLNEPDTFAISTAGGYLIAQESVLGPWIAHDPRTAADLLDSALALNSGKSRRVMIPSENTEGVNIAQRYGLTVLREVTHMRCGPVAVWDRTRIYGHASYALG